MMTVFDAICEKILFIPITLHKQIYNMNAVNSVIKPLEL